MVECFAWKYYQCQQWDVKEGDYYVIGRSAEPHWICQVVEANNSGIGTVMLKYHNTSVSYWIPKEFTTDGFGVNRLQIPRYVLDDSEFFNLDVGNPFVEAVTTNSAAVDEKDSNL